jgi:hypothetical protein
MENKITKIQFLESDLTKISQVYLGKRNCCRCGCGGDYTATSHMASPRSEINDTLVLKRLKSAKKLVNNGADIIEGSTYFEVETGIDRCLTFYFDEIKK